MIDGVCPRSFVTQLDGKHDTITRRDKNRQTHGPSLSTKCQWNLLVVFAIRLKVMPRWTHKAQSSVTYFHWLTWTQPGRTPLISSEKRPSEIYFLQTTGWRLYQSGKRIPPLTSEIGFRRHFELQRLVSLFDHGMELKWWVGVTCHVSLSFSRDSRRRFSSNSHPYLSARLNNRCRW